MSLKTATALIGLPVPPLIFNGKPNIETETIIEAHTGLPILANIKQFNIITVEGVFPSVNSPWLITAVSFKILFASSVKARCRTDCLHFRGRVSSTSRRSVTK